MLTDALKRGLRSWTTSMMGDGLEEKIASLKRSENEYGVDPFGFSLDYSLSAIAPFIWLYKHYFRVETFGVEKVPRGRVLLIANHSGQLPMDGAMIGGAMLLEATPPRSMRAMVEKCDADAAVGEYVHGAGGADRGHARELSPPKALTMPPKLRHRAGWR